MRGPLEVIFRQLDFKPRVFGTFAKRSSDVRDFIDIVDEYGMDPLGMSMATMTPDVVRGPLLRRFRAHSSLATWRGYAN